MADGGQPSAFPGLRGGVSDGLSARMLLSSIRRHWGVVVGLSVLLCALGAAIGLGLPPRFQAEGVLVINSRPERLADIQELSGSTPDLPAVRSEVDVLQSRSVIEPVVRSLALWRLPEFRGNQNPGGWSWQILRTRLRMISDQLRGYEDGLSEASLAGTPSNDPGVPPDAEINLLAEKYAGNLQVGTDGHSMTIRVAFRARTPERAAEVVNAHLRSFERVQRESEASASKRANAWLTSRTAELRTQLQAAEAAIGQYREQHHLTGAAPESAALSQQLANLNSQLIAAQADLAESEARAGQIDANGAGKDRAASVPEVVASPTIQLLRGQEAELIQREAGLIVRYGDAYPQLQRVRASLQELRGQINREISRNHAAASQLVERSRAREQSIQQSIVELTRQVNSADAGLQELEGKAESIRSILHAFEKRAEETAASPAFITSNSTIVSWANPSAVSMSQKALLLPGVGAVAGLIIGSLLALLREHRDKTFRTSVDVQQQIGARAIGATPRAVCRGCKSVADIVLADTGSAFAEAMRLSWTNIQLTIEGAKTPAAREKRPGTALGITSAAIGEGKSTHALALARTAAIAGESVILIDADLRRCGVSRLLQQSPSRQRPSWQRPGQQRPGQQSSGLTLGDFLQGKCALGDVISAEESSGLHFVVSEPIQLLWTTQSLRRFAELIDRLKLQYTTIIVDMPPILGLAETVRLTSVVDGMVLIIRWGRTERDMVRYALDALSAAGIFATAVILNDINLRTQRWRGYSDRTFVYSDKGLYRAAGSTRRTPMRSALPVASSVKERNLEPGRPERDFEIGTHND